MQKQNQKPEKWSNDQIETLIDAYKEELCLFATNLATYHNKHLRADAMERVYKAVMRSRPITTSKECSAKFHNLRNQFNIENAKVKRSFKSGTGTDDIYKPSLWYYEKLLFLDPYVAPRKSRNSIKNEVKKSDLLCENTDIYTLEESSNQSLQFGDNEYIQEIFVPDDMELLTQDNLAESPSQQHFIHPSHISPPLSTSSTSASPRISNGRSKKKFRSNPVDDEYASAINHLAESMSQPITIKNMDSIGNTSTPSSNSVDTFVVFIGSLLRTITNEDIKLEAMHSITQTAFNAKSKDINRDV